MPRKEETPMADHPRGRGRQGSPGVPREPVNHLIRMHFAKNDETLNEALNRLEHIRKIKK